MGTGAVATWNAVYLPPIVERFDALLPGFNFTQNNIHGMLYALAYGIANAGFVLPLGRVSLTPPVY